MADVLVRPAEPADLSACVDLTWSVAEEGRWIAIEAPFDRRARRERLRELVDDPGGLLLVAEAVPDAGDHVRLLVGHLALEPTSYGVLDLGMMVARSWRGRGVGRELVAESLRWARERTDAHKVALQVWPDNEAAIRLYERFGFVEEGRLRRHYRRRSGELRDAVIMGRLLREGPPPA